MDKRMFPGGRALAVAGCYTDGKPLQGVAWPPFLAVV